MIRLRHKLLIHALRLLDQMVIVVCLATVGGARAAAYVPGEVAAIILALMMSMLAFNHFVSYDANRFTSLGDQLLSLVNATTATMAMMLAVGALLSVPGVHAAGAVRAWMAATVVVGLVRVLARELLKYWRRSGRTSRQLLVVGRNAQALSLAATFDQCPELGYRLLGFVAENAEDAGALPAPDDSRVLGRLDDLQPLLERCSVDEVLICLSLRRHHADIAHIIRLGEQAGIVVRVVPDRNDEQPLLRRMSLERFEDQLVFTFFRESLLLQLMVKRMVDVTASLALLIMLSPLMAAVAALIKLTSPGPVLFVQERVGMNRRRFRLYKFRSMKVDADAQKAALAHLNEMDGPVFKISNDPRVTPVGRFIRRTSIDELPQLFNVLTGSMSLVGPRPPVPAEVEQYDWLFQRRLSIKPGITCLWQVSGRNHISFREWMELDRQYVANWSLWLDLKILLRTIPVVLIGRGAS